MVVQGSIKIAITFLISATTKKDFGLSAEWNFFATSHGKGPCDGLDGTVKRLATKASLQRYSEGRVSDQYSLQYLFFDFCSVNIKNINFVYSTNAEYEQEQVLLKDRHNNINTIAGTQNLHYFRSVSFNKG